MSFGFSVRWSCRHQRCHGGGNRDGRVRRITQQRINAQEEEKNSSPQSIVSVSCNYFSSRRIAVGPASATPRTKTTSKGYVCTGSRSCDRTYPIAARRNRIYSTVTDNCNRSNTVCDKSVNGSTDGVSNKSSCCPNTNKCPYPCTSNSNRDHYP